MFQFLGRNSGRSDPGCCWIRWVNVEVSIPRSEFWSFGLLQRTVDCPLGIRVSIPRSEFWSFGPCLWARRRDRARVVSIPRSEFWSFGLALVQQSQTHPRNVSIPRSEFWSFGRDPGEYHPVPYRLFQFLGRNSGRSDQDMKDAQRVEYLVSIPRSEFWSFGPHGAAATSPARPVSIPRSEFWSFGRGRCLLSSVRDESFNSSVGILVVRTPPSGIHSTRGHLSFNSSVGILVVRTAWAFAARAAYSEFQFLGRNSGRSDVTTDAAKRLEKLGFNSSVGILVVRTIIEDVDTPSEWAVSIPRSEFWSFGRDFRKAERGDDPVSIPRSEFWSFGPGSGRGAKRWSRGFNSSVGILVVRTNRCCCEGVRIILFQFLGRNSGRSDARIQLSILTPL